MSYGCRRCRDFSHPNKEGLWMDDLQFVGLLPVTLRLVLSVFPVTILCLHYQESLRFCCLVRSHEVCGCLFVPALYFAVSSHPGRRTRPTAAALTLGWVTGPHHTDPPPPPVSLLYIKKPNRADAEHLGSQFSIQSVRVKQPRRGRVQKRQWMTDQECGHFLYETAIQIA